MNTQMKLKDNNEPVATNSQVLSGNPFQSDVCLPALSSVHLPNDDDGNQPDTRQLEKVDIIDISSSKGKESSSSSKGSKSMKSSKSPKSSKGKGGEGKERKSMNGSSSTGKGGADEHKIPYFHELVEWVVKIVPDPRPSPTLDTNVEDRNDNLEPLAEDDDILYENFFGSIGEKDPEGLLTFDESSEENDDDRKPPAENDDDRKPHAENGEDHEPSVEIRNFTML